MFDILDQKKYIKDNNWLKVTNQISFSKDMNPTEDGLYSRTIFGITKKEQFFKCGYIDLNYKILHPLIYKNITSVHRNFKFILNKEKKFIVKNGELIESEIGWTGLKDLYNNWDKIDFNKFDEKNFNNKEFLRYLSETSKNIIFIDTLIIIPVNFRPAVLKNGLMVEDELSGLYKGVMQAVGTGSSDASNEFMKKIYQLTDKQTVIQHKVNALYDYYLQFLDKKDGLFRSKLIGKKIDNVTRLVANAQPSIPLDTVVVPWHALLVIFDIAVIGFLAKKSNEYKEKLGVKDLSVDEIADVFDFIFRNVDIYSHTHKDQVLLWQMLLLETFNNYPELRIILKRDPAWSKESYHTLKPIINTNNEYACIVNSMIYNPLGGDSFYTNNTIIKNKNETINSNNSGEIRLEKGNKSYLIKSMHKIFENIKNKKDM